MIDRNALSAALAMSADYRAAKDLYDRYASYLRASVVLPDRYQMPEFKGNRAERRKAASLWQRGVRP